MCSATVNYRNHEKNIQDPYDQETHKKRNIRTNKHLRAMSTKQIQAHRQRKLHEKHTRSDESRSGYQSIKQTPVKDEDYCNVLYTERSKNAVFVWLALFLACVGFWIGLLMLIF